MNDHLSPFDLLSNEFLIKLFQHFNAQHLFQSFYNLNIRLNRLLESFHNLKLVFYLTTSNNSLISNDQIFHVYVHTLIVDSNVDVDLNRFPNIRRLKFEWFSMTELVKISTNVLPYLEELNLVYIATLRPNNGLLLLPRIRTFKIRFIDFSSYQTFLFARPNLSCLQCSIFTSDKCTLNHQIHNNLKQLIIKLSRITESFKDYDWLASIMSYYLLKLICFKFYLRTIHSINYRLFIEINKRAT
ncbi:unnamed protein product [Rotaria magnacalcarata]